MKTEQVLKNLHISELNAMQKEVINAASKEGDIVLLSATGSGKTLGFLLPLLSRLDPEKKGVQALILVPSRELAIQIEGVFKQMSTGFKINCCYGGHSTRIEKNNLEHPPAVLVGTPGRIAYHIRNTNFDVNAVNMLVLDEFDKSLEFGFKEDMSFIIYELKNLQRRMLTSATNLEEIPAFTGVKKPVMVNFLGNAPVRTDGLKLKMISGKEKLDLLFDLVCKYGNKATLIFCNHRDAVERISQVLKNRNIAHDIFHGGMEQDDRERALIKFRNGSHRILITTDLASRGLDIPEIEMVVHYQLPTTEDSFTHRNGRTARMNAKGTAYLLLSEGDHVPPFIKTTPEKESLEGSYPLPENTPWSTLYIAAGKKDKINKMDIVGMLLQKGKLEKDELGLIEVLDKSAYVAVKRNKIEKVVQLVREEKIKGRKIKMAVSE